MSPNGIGTPRSRGNSATFPRKSSFKKFEEQGIKPLDMEILLAMGRVWPEDEDVDDFLRAREHWRRQSVNRGAIP